MLDLSCPPSSSYLEARAWKPMDEVDEVFDVFDINQEENFQWPIDYGVEFILAMTGRQAAHMLQIYRNSVMDDECGMGFIDDLPPLELKHHFYRGRLKLGGTLYEKKSRLVWLWLEFVP
jgi:hypothetical protein